MRKKVNELKKSIDGNGEIESIDFKNAKKLTVCSDETHESLSGCNIYIITVPTPIDEQNNPDLSFLKKASATVGRHLSDGDIVIYESTVFPGCTEEICVPLLESISKKKHNQDFFTGYSPERINPGDKTHTLKTIIKVTSGSDDKTADKVDALYKAIVPAGTKRAKSIQIAEAAKVIENTQRDINIAFMNELAILFEKLNLNTQEVLDVASTKWNFLNFKPGLVGGHCIGVDPYYLTHKAKQKGFHPEIILAGRRINDEMPTYIANHFVKLFLKKGLQIENAHLLILGFTFKENCSDIRNSKVVKLVNELHSYRFSVDVFDPLAPFAEVKNTYGITLIKESDLQQKHYDGILYCVNHKHFKALNIESLRKDKSLTYAVVRGYTDFDIQL